MTWNPVWGCKNKCEYCYARKMAKRFAERINIQETRYNKKNRKDYNNSSITIIEDYQRYVDLKNFKPTFLESQFNKEFPKKPQRIFVGSMSEIYYWKPEWMERVIEKIKQYPQHTFQFLTKFPEVYAKYVFPENCWLGMTITKEDDINKDWGYFINVLENCFFSIEPFLDRINPESLECIDWVIIGAETGNRKNKVIPKREWIGNIVSYCRNNNIPIYLKDSLKGIYSTEMKEFPMEV